MLSERGDHTGPPKLGQFLSRTDPAQHPLEGLALGEASSR